MRKIGVELATSAIAKITRSSPEVKEKLGLMRDKIRLKKRRKIKGITAPSGR